MSDIDEMDNVLRAAMGGRGEPLSGLRGEALAVAAMRRAAGAELHARRLAKAARWMRMTSVAAGILLVAALAVGGYWYTAAAGINNVATVGVDGEALVNATGSTLDLAMVGWMVLGAVVVGLAVKVVMVPERQGFGMGYA